MPNTPRHPRRKIGAAGFGDSMKCDFFVRDDIRKYRMDE